MAQRPRKEDPPPKDSGRILFLSLNMILLAFFILLVALSQENHTKQAQLSIEVRKAFQSFGGSYLGLGRFLEQRGISRDRSALESSQQIEQFLGELTLFIEHNEDATQLSYEITREGLTVQIPSAFAFREGTDRLLPVSQPLFNHLLDLIRHTTNPVRIEGHLDNREEATGALLDKWQLSAARATAVFRYFLRSGEVPESRFSVVGYADTRPIATNLTEAGRARNRRVTVTLVGTLKPVGEQR